VFIFWHPLVEPYTKTAGLVNIINQNNYTFITHQNWLDLNSEPTVCFFCYSKKWEKVRFSFGTVSITDD
jgi:hypothetical protein